MLHKRYTRMADLKSKSSTKSLVKMSLLDLKGIDISEHIPYKVRSQISEKTGFTPSYVGRVISGKNWNEDILKEAIEVIKLNEEIEVPEKIASKVG